jgi:hypothetical protein
LHNTLHVSDILSVHHQEIEMYIQQQAYVKQLASDTSVCLTYEYACCCMYSPELLMMGGKTARNM